MKKPKVIWIVLAIAAMAGDGVLLLRLGPVPADTEQLALLRAEGSLNAPNLPVNVFGR
jgi:hypothetical protein